ncbi:MAG: tetratricopeptide 2 repeat protein [Deltaproteobacteria bacterium]|nr:tetratricopeptide 2 repeat protein [Deltaproteobacteria bacterium]
MRRTLLIALLLATLSVLPLQLLPAAFAGQAGADLVLTDAGSIKAFGDSLFHRESLFQSSMEYERFLYLHPSHPDAPGVMCNLTAVAQRAGDQQAVIDRSAGDADREKSLLGFADHLFEQGHYYQAVTEYERFIYFNPGHPSVPLARLQTARCYKLGAQYDKAVDLYRQLAEQYTGREEGIEAAFQAGECFRLGEDFDQALGEYSRFIRENASHPLADKARWNMAWTYLQLEDYHSARKELTSLCASSLYRKPSQELIAALDELHHARHKSPVIAGALAALMPGAGHLYTGQKKQALFSFVTNALLMFGSYEAFDKQLYTAGGFLSLFSLNYYSGNIFGAITGAHKFNRQKREEHLRQVMQTYADQGNGFPPSRE